MRAVGLITEYNPFHNGHLHHLLESRESAGAEVAVAVMSGHFLQRGEPALVDKWVRTKMALAAGVDVVVELPFPFACNSAPHFAAGAVGALNALGADTLCFGSESGDLASLESCARLLLDREAEIEKKTAELLRAGKSFPAARARVVADLAGDSAAVETLRTPNNILGIEYLKALRASGSPIRPLTIPRIGAGYHDVEAVGEIASATGIRQLLAAEGEVAPYIPAASRPAFSQALAAGCRLDPDLLHRLLLARLFAGRGALRNLYLVEDGIENRLVEAAATSSSYEELVAAVKSRQFTRTRIQRLLAHVLNGTEKDEMAGFLEAGPVYLHLLGCSGRGRAFLATSRKARTLPLIGNFSRIYPILKRFYGGGTERFRLAEGMLALEMRATRNYTLLLKRWEGRSRNRDFFEEIIFEGR